MIDPTTHRAYVLVPGKHTKTRAPVYIKAESYMAFLDMSNAARKDGVDLRITSGRRSFVEQEILFAHYGFDRALPPGTSSHHF
jgi:LAS superfamily LD-carboxypeptidase LdcB